MYEKITPENVVMYAIKHYDNPQAEGEKEFEDDLKRFKYIKRLFRRYQETNILKERLVLNHLIVLQNVFSADVAITLLLYKTDEQYWPVLKACLNYLEYLYPHELESTKADDKIEEMLKQL